MNPALKGEAPPALCLHEPDFHEGVIGIVAGRLKDRLHRPTFVLARGADGLLKGSGRSIPGCHLRDALDLVAKRHPGLLLRFGGHAMAAGCTLAEAGVGAFGEALARVAQEWLLPADLNLTLPTDGPWPLEYFNAATVQQLEGQVWGEGCEAPVFCDEVDVLQQRLVGEKHLKLRVRHAGQCAEPRGLASEPLRQHDAGVVHLPPARLPVALVERAQLPAVVEVLHELPHERTRSDGRDTGSRPFTYRGGTGQELPSLSGGSVPVAPLTARPRCARSRSPRV